jgi:hypothetical protein
MDLAAHPSITATRHIPPIVTVLRAQLSETVTLHTPIEVMVLVVPARKMELLQTATQIDDALLASMITCANIMHVLFC